MLCERGTSETRISCEPPECRASREVRAVRGTCTRQSARTSSRSNDSSSITLRALVRRSRDSSACATQTDGGLGTPSIGCRSSRSSSRRRHRGPSRDSRSGTREKGLRQMAVRPTLIMGVAQIARRRLMALRPASILLQSQGRHVRSLRCTLGLLCMEISPRLVVGRSRQGGHLGTRQNRDDCLGQAPPEGPQWQSLFSASMHQPGPRCVNWLLARRIGVRWCQVRVKTRTESVSVLKRYERRSGEVSCAKISNTCHLLGRESCRRRTPLCAGRLRGANMFAVRRARA